MLKVLERSLRRLETICGIVASLVALLVMLIVASDVGLRYLAGRPWTWAYDFVGIYLTVMLFYLALPKALAEDGHIRLDLIHQFAGPKLLRVFEIVNALLAACLFALIAFLGARKAVGQFIDGDVIAAAVDWPTWLATAFVPIGAGLVVLRLMLSIWGHALSLRTGVAQWPLPRSPGHGRSGVAGG